MKILYFYDMEDLYLKIAFLLAIIFTGILCGASLDQSIKQLPARRRIGVISFSEYAKAADLKNGVPWYAIIGVGSALTSILSAVIVLTNYQSEIYAMPVCLAAVFSVCHSVCTVLAAPIYHKQKTISDQKSLEKLFNKFELIQSFRSVFIALNFLSFIWVLFLII